MSAIHRRAHSSTLLPIGLAAGAGLGVSCGVGSTTAPPNIAITCTEGAVKPGAPISAGTKICGSLTLGDLALSADFSNTGKSDDLFEVYPAAHITDIHEAATFEAGTAVLHSSGSDQEADVAPALWVQGKPPAGTVGVVDFKSLSSSSALGFSPGCSADACVVVELHGDGKYRFGVRAGRSWSYPFSGDLNANTGYPAPRLDPSGENRLIVWLKRSELGAVLNGRQLGSIKVTPPAPNEAFLFFRSLGQNQASEVALTRVYFFAAGH